MSMLKRQRELKKAEKAARKRAKKHGVHEEGFTEPRPTVSMGDLMGAKPSDDEAEDDDPPNSSDSASTAEAERKSS
jgi:hypothetical protein